jgi:hypothetical protein
MTKFNRSTVLSLAALGALSACVSQEPVTPAPVAVQTAPTVVAPAGTQVIQPGSQAVVVPAAPVVVQGSTAVVSQLRAGVGRITSINKLSENTSPGLEPVRRIGIAMNDGNTQYVDTRAPRLSVGDYVEITSDSQIRYPVSQSNPRY